MLTGKHNFKATLEDGRIVVRDGNKEIKVNFACTADCRTCYAHVVGIGFIGGWTPSQTIRNRKFFGRDWVPALVSSINRGIVWYDQNHLGQL